MVNKRLLGDLAFLISSSQSSLCQKSIQQAFKENRCVEAAPYL